MQVEQTEFSQSSNDEFLFHAAEIQYKIFSLETKLVPQTPTFFEHEKLQYDDTMDEIADEPGVYVAIVDYHPPKLTSSHVLLPVDIGQMIKVTRVLSDGWVFGENQTTKEIGQIPLSVLVRLSGELLLELATDPSPEQSNPYGEDEVVISMSDLKTASSHETHCMETLLEENPAIYFTWRYGGGKVYVWGNFNNWEYPVQLFFDGPSGIFVAFADCVYLSNADQCEFKFVVDDEWKIDPSLPIIYNEDGTRLNTIKVSSHFAQGEMFCEQLQLVRYKLPDRIARHQVEHQGISWKDTLTAFNDARIRDAIEDLLPATLIYNHKDSSEITNRKSILDPVLKLHRFDSGISLLETFEEKKPPKFFGPFLPVDLVVKNLEIECDYIQTCHTIKPIEEWNVDYDDEVKLELTIPQSNPFLFDLYVMLCLF
ncbi:hypothetical protein HDV01_003547 [Terramyces sp. JEL0728]|nr:hypothetical protein HDV01_003545 [Terramyces sp. JEL0728]KAJ3274054.1 hypothetical protein HDV01_003547 [Terramyces sp. JEL0728]